MCFLYTIHSAVFKEHKSFTFFLYECLNLWIILVILLCGDFRDDHQKQIALRRCVGTTSEVQIHVCHRRDRSHCIPSAFLNLKWWKVLIVSQAFVNTFFFFFHNDYFNTNFETQIIPFSLLPSTDRYFSLFDTLMNNLNGSFVSYLARSVS